jgi:hypothetical protein
MSGKDADPAVDAEGQRIKEPSTTAGLPEPPPYARDSTPAMLHRFHARKFADHMERPVPSGFDLFIDISIDSYPGRTFGGHVESLQSGSGNVFSLLPAENATGNYVKIVQRIPVKIVFDQPPAVFIGPGMSVVPTVRVR